jgi:hypothetical protein
MVDYILLNIKNYGYITSDSNGEDRWLKLNGHIFCNICINYFYLTYVLGVAIMFGFYKNALLK